MEEYSDLKFDGDLSFLNENLDAAKNSLKENKSEIVNEEKIIEEPIVNTYTQPNPVQETPKESMENFNDTMNTQNNSSFNKTETPSAPQMEQRVATQSPQQSGEKKSQLEEMILNSGYGAEMFNNLKMELLEMEKEKIIMKYKQDLMMMIIKS